MLQSEAFLGNFLPVDHLTGLPVYLDDFSTVAPGYYDLRPGNRIYYLGLEPPVVRSMETINAFLDAMSFASIADRTNTVAAALTVLLRWQWRGEKPLVLDTATKSHSRKGTITDFFRGAVPKADILYKSVDWPMQQQFPRQIQMDGGIGVVVFDNVRFVDTFSQPGDLVVDPCGGGFTTACHRLGRRFVGCDIDKVAVLKGQERLALEVATSHAA